MEKPILAKGSEEEGTKSGDFSYRLSSTLHFHLQEMKKKELYSVWIGKEENSFPEKKVSLEILKGDFLAIWQHASILLRFVFRFGRYDSAILLLFGPPSKKRD